MTWRSCASRPTTRTGPGGASISNSLDICRCGPKTSLLNGVCAWGAGTPPPPQSGEVKDSDEDDKEGGERGRGGNRHIPEKSKLKYGRQEPGPKLGRKEGSTRGGGDTASGGNRSQGNRKISRVEKSFVFSVRRLTYRNCVETSKSVAGMGTLQQKSPVEKSAGSLVVVKEIFVLELEGHSSRATQRVPIRKCAAFFLPGTTDVFSLVSRLARSMLNKKTRKHTHRHTHARVRLPDATIHSEIAVYLL